MLAHVCLAGSNVSAAGLGEEGLAAVGAEPGSEGLEGGVDVVGYAFGVGAGVVAVEVFVDVTWIFIVSLRFLLYENTLE